MLRMTTAIMTLVIVSWCEFACSDQSGLGVPGDGGAPSVGGSGGKVAAGGGGGSQAGSGGISGAGGCSIEPPCALLNCPYGYAPSSLPCGCGQCAPPPDAGVGGGGLGGGLGGAIGAGGTGAGGARSGGAGGATSCSPAICPLPPCLGGEYQPNPADPCGCSVCVKDGGAPTDGGKKDATADSSTDVHVCGPICDIYCQYGNVLDSWGCPTCQCRPAPGCPTGSHAVTCPADTACALDCNEYQRGSDGCQTCACRTPATCAPPGAAACVYCPFGYRTGPGGCTTCSCADPPMGCAANPADGGP